MVPCCGFMLNRVGAPLGQTKVMIIGTVAYYFRGHWQCRLALLQICFDGSSGSVGDFVLGLQACKKSLGFRVLVLLLGFMFYDFSLSLSISQSLTLPLSRTLSLALPSPSHTLPHSRSVRLSLTTSFLSSSLTKAQALWARLQFLRRECYSDLSTPEHRR